MDEIEQISAQIRLRKRCGLRGKYISMKDRKGLVKQTSKFHTNEGEYTIMTNQQILLGTSDMADMITSKFIEKRIKAGVQTIQEKLTVRGSHKLASKFIRANFKEQIISCPTQSRYIIDFGDSLLEAHTYNSTIEFYAHGTFERIDELFELIGKHFEEINVYISWIYDKNMSRTTVPIDAERLPVEEMYSFIDDGETLANYYDAFMKSSANILILIGPPGTGKTSFIRGFLHHTESSAMVTYDEQVVSTDTLFTEFLDDSSNVLVLEDADTFLRPRSDGNNMISRFLNIGDGLPSVRGKKLIFSTNLPSIKEIDPALLRPGRTFDVLHFSGLTAEKATKLAKKFDIDFVPTEGRTEDYTVSEIFTGLKVNAGPVKRKFGFC